MNRRGFQLIELVIALVIAAGPLFGIIELTRSSLRGAGANQERTAAQLVLADLMECAHSSGPHHLEKICGPDAAERLDRMLERRIRELPEQLQGRYRDQTAALKHHMTASIEPVAEGPDGLFRLRFTVTLKRGQVIALRRLLRLGALPRSIGRKVKGEPPG